MASQVTDVIPLRITRVVVTALMGCAIPGLILWLMPTVPPKVHSWVLASGAILFSISEIHFRSLLSELSAVLRRGTYSVWQMERLRQEVPKLRNSVWRLWDASLFMKFLVALAAAALQWDNLRQALRPWCIYTGYSLLMLSFAVAASGRRRFRRIEQLCDDIGAKEIEIREQKRLRGELTSGDPHDFQKDDVLKSYGKPSQPL